MDAYQRKLWWAQIHNIKLKEQEQIEIKHMSNWILDDLVYNKSWFCYVLFRFSQTAVKTFNPYKSHVSRPSQQGSNTGILSASSLLTSLKWFLSPQPPSIKTFFTSRIPQKKQERCWKSNNNQQEFSIHRDHRRRNQGWPLSFRALTSPSKRLRVRVRLVKSYTEKDKYVFQLQTATLLLEFSILSTLMDVSGSTKTKPQSFNTCSRLKCICKLKFSALEQTRFLCKRLNFKITMKQECSVGFKSERSLKTWPITTCLPNTFKNGDEYNNADAIAFT